MTDALIFAAKAARSLMVLYGAVYVIALSRPLFFYEHLASGEVSQNRWRAALGYTLIALKVISVGMFFYYAAYAIVQIVPGNWMHYDEDGDVVSSSRGYIQVLLAVVGTSFALDGEMKVSKEGRLKLEERREKWGY